MSDGMLIDSHMYAYERLANKQNLFGVFGLSLTHHIL